ncbi:MAG: glycosyltransferase [Prevotella sp.]
MKPLLSIIIPLYNCEKYINQCLDSILLQDFDKACYEVIIVDDGSTDNSFTIAKAYSDRNDNIRVVKQENQGVACTRNNAIGIASGKYIAFVDADDMIVEGSLRTLVDIAVNNNAEIVKATHLEVPQDAVYEEYNSRTDSKPSIEVMTGEEAIVKVTKLKEGYCWGYLISRQLITDNRLTFPPKVAFMEDWAFITQAILKSKVFVNTDILFYLYRHNTSSCVANMSTGKLLQACRSIEIIANAAIHTDGEAKRKLSENVCVNINIILWYTIHYRSIYRDRKEITRALVQLLKLVKPQYIPNSLKPFRLSPCVYIVLRHLMASRKY